MPGGSGGCWWMWRIRHDLEIPHQFRRETSNEESPEEVAEEEVMPDPERLRTLIDEYYESAQIPEIPPEYWCEEEPPDDYPWTEPLT